MALINTFNFIARTENKGKITQNPLTVRFSTDAVPRRRVGETTSYCLATRYTQKRYSWNGYTLSMAKQIASFYANGNSGRCGYYRRFREYTFSPTSGWTYRTVYKTLTSVDVSRQDGNMYTVDISIDEEDQFLVDADNIPNTYDLWCGAFSTFYTGDEWARVDFGSTTPYKFEAFYDETLTVREATNG